MQDDPDKSSTSKSGTARPQSREDRLKAALKVQAKTRAKVQSQNDKEDE